MLDRPDLKRHQVNGGRQQAGNDDLVFDDFAGKLLIRGKPLVAEAPRDGRAYARKNAAWLTIAEIVGPRGERGPPGRDGNDGQDGERGSLWFTGNGPPELNSGIQRGDMYLDESTGDVWRFE